jgi:hypothetical protein
MIEEEAVRRMEHAKEMLAEFFPSVQILVSRPNLEQPGNTEYLHVGYGDVFARRGLAQYWLDMDKNHDQAKVLAEYLKKDGD